MKELEERIKTYEPFWGEWTKVESLGSGGQSEVYKIQKEGNKYAALKIVTIKENGLEGYEKRLKYIKEKLEKAKREIENMCLLKNCKNIVKYEDHLIKEIKDEANRIVGYDILIRMELLTCLRENIRDNKIILSEEEVKKVAYDIGNALKELHKMKIIHRDIKPENIFIDVNGVYKLGDLGVSRDISSASTITAVGTKPYEAPELEKCKEDYEQLDIYSLGIVLYEFLNNNQIPFVNENSSYNEYIEAIKRRRINGESFDMPLNGSYEFKRIVMKACAYKKEDRYKKIEEFLCDLNKLNNLKGSEKKDKPSYNSMNEDIFKTVSADEFKTLEADKTNGNIGQNYKKVPPIKNKKKYKITKYLKIILIVLIIFTFYLKITNNTIGWNIKNSKIYSKITNKGVYSIDDGVLSYTIEEGNATVSRCIDKNKEDIIIPSKINGISVVKIGSEAFSECDKMKTITIPESIKEIDDYAFKICSSLEKVEIPKSVIFIGIGLFRGCENLKDVEFLGEIEKIPSEIFKNDSSLTNIKMPSTLKIIGKEAFYGCTSLSNITIPESVTNIEDNAFGFCRALKSIVIPESVVNIEDNAFQYCSALTNVRILSNIKILNDNIFAGCIALNSINIPDTIIEIGNNVFYNNTKLTIYYYKNTYLEEYCKKENIKLVQLTAPKINKFTPDKKSPQISKTEINLNVDAVGEGELQYKFLIKDEDGNWEVIRNYSSLNTCIWTTKEIGNNILYVDVKDVNGEVTRESISYTVKDTYETNNN